jgi:hypothetical protein
VHRFEDRRVFADVAARGQAESAHQAGDLITQDVTKHVFHDQHIELIRVEHELHGRGINDLIFEFDPPRIFGRDLLPDLEKQSLRKFQDIGFVS